MDDSEPSQRPAPPDPEKEEAQEKRDIEDMERLKQTCLGRSWGRRDDWRRSVWGNYPRQNLQDPDKGYSKSSAGLHWKLPVVKRKATPNCQQVLTFANKSDASKGIRLDQTKNVEPSKPAKAIADILVYNPALSRSSDTSVIRRNESHDLQFMRGLLENWSVQAKW